VAGVPLNGSGIDHDGESKARVILGFGLDEFGAFVNGIIRPVPVNDDAIDSAAHHVINLSLDLRWIIRAVANIHVAGAAEPGQ
jgi:hypothetical protein